VMGTQQRFSTTWWSCLAATDTECHSATPLPF